MLRRIPTKKENTFHLVSYTTLVQTQMDFWLSLWVLESRYLCWWEVKHTFLLKQLTDNGVVAYMDYGKANTLVMDQGLAVVGARWKLDRRMLLPWQLLQLSQIWSFWTCITESIEKNGSFRLSASPCPWGLPWNSSFLNASEGCPLSRNHSGFIRFKLSCSHKYPVRQ